LSRLQPATDTVEVESVVANTPGYCAFLTRRRGLVGLALNAYWRGRLWCKINAAASREFIVGGGVTSARQIRTEIHDVVSADGAVIDDDV
jgi:hypothetical protein